MFPAQSSLIPSQIALVRFWEMGGNIFGNYPYWYLGTTPYHNLTGPFIPALLALIHKLLPDFSLFAIMFAMIGVFWLVGGVGVYFLISELRIIHSTSAGQANDELRIKTINPVALSATFFYLFGAIVPFLFRFTDGIYLIAFSFLPFTLLRYLKFIRKGDGRQTTDNTRLQAPSAQADGGQGLQKTENRGLKIRKNEILLIGLIAFVILLNSLIIPALIIGMVSLLLAQGDWDHIERKIKQSCWLLIFGVLLATLWYTPGYWFTLLGAPSLAGEDLFKVIASLGKLVPVALALSAAVFSVRIFKRREILRDFAFYWFFIFGFLSFLRFLSDPDFWLDWTAYGMEIQFGMAIILALILGKIEGRRQRVADRLLKTEDRGQITENRLSVFSFHHPSSVFCFRFSFLAVYFLIFVFIFNKYVLGTLQKDITSTVEYKISKQLESIANSSTSSRQAQRVLLSGSTVFWLNAFVDVPQVRGGVDQASKDGSWRASVWEIREGEDPQKSLEALKKLKVKYLVVHTIDSLEYYHDFKYPYKFENLVGLEKIFEEDGDVIYRIED
jgi:hypothetical protein